MRKLVFGFYVASSRSGNVGFLRWKVCARSGQLDSHPPELCTSSNSDLLGSVAMHDVSSRHIHNLILIAGEQNSDQA